MVLNAAAETPTLRALLARHELGLRLEGDEAQLADGALDRPVRWVHSTDLLDPTPFLADDLALLTTGRQLDDANAALYVERLVDHGVLGLGFGTGMGGDASRTGIPPAVVVACRAHRLPLFEVPYRTPFIAVARANADAVAAQTYARRSWALAAQRAVALAALRPDGLGETLAELSRRLGAWVGLFDSAGVVGPRHPGDLPATQAGGVAAEVAAVLERGTPAGSSLTIDGAPFTLQTLGRHGHLRGVLAIRDGELDQEARGVVTTVVAMAELSFAQGEQLAGAAGRLRTALLASLETGDPSLTRDVAVGLWTDLPAEPIEVAVLRDAGDAVTTHLEERGTVFFARDGADVVLVTPPGDPLAGDLADRFGVRMGVSAPTPYDEFARARAQAEEALRHGTGTVVRFGDVAASGVLSAIDSDSARLRAEALLAPLRTHDATEGARLEATLRAWLENDARFDATAEALEVHRHTVRARIAHAARLLDMDLAGFPPRAEVWAALRLAP